MCSFLPERQLFLVACLLAGAWALPASADECATLAPPSVIMNRLADTVDLDTHLGYRSITALATSLSRPGTRVLGLTRGMARVRIEVKTTSFRDRLGRWECASPQLLVTYGYSPMTVYVASEFPRGTCAFNEIYAHELRHVKAYQEHLTAVEKEIGATLNARFATGGVWRGPVGQASARIRQELDERWVPYLQREIGKAEAAQALIDTPDEYARVSASCGGEVRRLMAQRGA